MEEQQKISLINNMKIHKVAVVFLKTNCYLVSDDETKETIIIDPGDEAGKIIMEIENNDLKPKVILLTHAHFDHIGAVQEIKNYFKIDCLKTKEGDVVIAGDTKLRVIETPGHKEDCVCFVCEDCVFSGDTFSKFTPATAGRPPLAPNAFSNIFLFMSS